MATNQVGGSAVTPTSTNNRIGRIKGARTASLTSGLLKGVESGRQQGFEGTAPRDGTDTNKVISAGTFNNFDLDKWIIRRITDTVAGQANTKLRSGARGMTHYRSIHSKTTDSVVNTASAIRSGNWNPTEATWSVAPSAGTSSYGTDHAVSNTPSEIVYRYGSGNPYQDEYNH